MRSLGLLLVLLGALVLAGCGGDDEPTASTAAPETAPATTAAAPASSDLTTDQLGAMLLTLEDMPTGWARFENDPPGKPLCEFYGFRQQAVHSTDAHPR